MKWLVSSESASDQRFFAAPSVQLAAWHLRPSLAAIGLPRRRSAHLRSSASPNPPPDSAGPLGLVGLVGGNVGGPWFGLSQRDPPGHGHDVAIDETRQNLAKSY